MKIAMIGMGKLGFPVALAWALEHEVVGYDISPHAKKIVDERKYPHREEQAQELLEKTTLRVVDTVGEAVAHADIVFIAVETPHQPKFEGITRMPDDRADFDYKSLKVAVASVAYAAAEQRKKIVLVVVSTVLPGTTRRELDPILADNPFVSYVYSPMFIAMGTTIGDALDPEMVLVGMRQDGGHAFEMLQKFYEPLHDAELLPMRVESAELAKVGYNVFLGLKIVGANALMEIAHKTGADSDEVTEALVHATDRVISSKYMRGGMGDGGGCHPRDQIALSWLANELDLSFDLFSGMVMAREYQTEWLANMAVEEAKLRRLPIVVLGKAYKKDTNLTIGSPAILLANILREKWSNVEQWDPHVDGEGYTMHPSVFIIGTDHDVFFEKLQYPEGSVIIDPWRKMEIDGRNGADMITLISVGRR